VNRALLRRPVVGWALYDWANSAFATTVMAGFFPIFFKQYWSVGTEAAVSTFRLGILSGAGSLVIALAAPLLGAMADRGGARLRLLAFFTVIGAAATAGLYAVAQGNWVGAALVYSLAGIGFWGGVIFNDALLVDVAEPPQYDLVSAFGYSLGYAGGGILLLLNVAMVTTPATFGLADAAQAVRVGFLTVAAWWMLFTLPCLIWVREPARASCAQRSAKYAGTGRWSGSCSPTGSTSTASTRSSRWRWITACPSALRSRA
jgi:MFS transporter, UMF1 family